MPYQYSDMSQAEIDEFLEAPRVAVVGSIRVDGPPQLTPVWYLYEDGRIYITMFVKSGKYRNLRRDPRISLCIPGESTDARAVMIYGTVELVEEESAQVDEIRWRLIRRYFDRDEEAQSFTSSEGMKGEKALAVVTPVKVLAQDYN